MGQTLPKPALAAVPCRGHARAGGDLRCRHRGIDRRRLQRGAAGSLGQRCRRRGAIRQAAWPAELTLIATLAEFAGRLCLAEGRRSYRHALCPSRRGRAGRGVDAVRRAGKARRRPRRESLTVDASDNAHGVFRQARLCRQPAQHRDRQWRMARQHHDAEDAGRRRIAGRSAHEPRTPLSVRHHAARRRADQRRRFHAARQAADRRDARRTRHRLCRGRLSRRQSDRHRILCREAEARSRHASPRSA